MLELNKHFQKLYKTIFNIAFTKNILIGFQFTFGYVVSGMPPGMSLVLFHRNKKIVSEI